MEFTALYYSFPVAAILIAAGWRPWRGEEAPRSGTWASSLAVPLCFVAAWYAVNNAWPALLPGDGGTAKDWLLPGIVLAALGCAAPCRLALQVFLAWGAAELIVGAGLARVLAQVESHGVWLELGLKAGVVLYAVQLAALARREGFEPPLIALVGLVAAATVQRGGWASGAWLLAAVGFVAGGAMVVGFWRRGWRPLRGAALAVGAAGAGVLVLGQQTAESPSWATLAAAAVPTVAWIPGRSGWGTLLRVALAAGIAVGAHYLSVPAPNPYAGY